MCIGGADGDSDGWCSGAADSNDGNPSVNAKSAQDAATDIATGGAVFTNAEERLMNTDPLGDCPATSSHNTWPPDFNNDKSIDWARSRPRPPSAGACL